MPRQAEHEAVLISRPFWQAAVDLMADILRYVTQEFLSCLLASLFLLCSLSLHAEAPLLPPEQAFPV